MRYVMDAENLLIGRSSGLKGGISIKSRPITREEAIHLLSEEEAICRVRRSITTEAIRSLGVSVSSRLWAFAPLSSNDDVVLVDILGENANGEIGFDLYHVVIEELRVDQCEDALATSSFLWPSL